MLSEIYQKLMRQGKEKKMARIVKSDTSKSTPNKGAATAVKKPETKTSRLKASIKNEARSIKGQFGDKGGQKYNTKGASLERTPVNISEGVAKTNLEPAGLELTLRRIEPISAAKLGFFISIALGIIFVIVVTFFWLLLDKSGIVFQISQALIGSGLGIKAGAGGLITLVKVAAVSGVLACINVVLTTAMAAIIAAIYNVASALSGGLKLRFTRG
jgi:hypothetical protein